MTVGGSEGRARKHLAWLAAEAAEGGVPGVPPLPELASELFGERGWLRRLIAATSDGDVAAADLAEAAAAAEGEWNRRVVELLSRLTRLEALAGDLEAGSAQEDERMALRAEIDIAAAAVRAVSQRDARSFLAELGLLGATMPPVDEASLRPTPADRILEMMGDGEKRGTGAFWMRG